MLDDLDERLDRGEALFATDLQSATAIFEEVLAACPDHLRALNDAGVAYFRAQRHDEAARVLRRALAIDPTDGNTVINLFHVEMALRRFEDARQLLVDHGASLTRSDLDQILGHLGRSLPAAEPAVNTRPLTLQDAAPWAITIHHHGERILAMPEGSPHHRNLREGYLRGCGIQFGNLRDLCFGDPLFARAHAAARPRSLVTDENLVNLYVLLRFYVGRLAAGHIVEFGTYRGGSAIFMAMVAREFLPGTRVVGFDTFEGMPPTDPERDAHKQGDFGDAGLEELRRHAHALGLDNLELVQGRFEDTCDAVLARLGAVRLAHVDCDIRSGVETAYSACKKVFVPGAYVVFDDPLTSSCLGAFEAVEDLLVRQDGLNAEQVYPHLVFRHPPGDLHAPGPATGRSRG